MGKISKSKKLRRKYCKFLGIRELPEGWVIHHICGKHIPDPDNVYNLYALPKPKAEFWSHNPKRKVMKGDKFDFETGFYRQPNEIWEIINVRDNLKFFNTPRSLTNAGDWKPIAKYWKKRQDYIGRSICDMDWEKSTSYD